MLQTGHVAASERGSPLWTMPEAGNGHAMIDEKAPITHVAIRFRGVVYSLPAPNRHHHVIAKIVQETGVDCVDGHGDDQGFLDANGRYLTRKQALVCAEVYGQIKPGTVIRANRLFSEDVW